MNENSRTENIIKLSFFLRIDDTYPFEAGGWHFVTDLLKRLGLSMEELEEIVEKDEKQRYQLTDDKAIIRARESSE